MSSISPERMNEYSGYVLRDVAIAFTVLETVAVGLRFVSLKLSQKPFGIDDALTIPGYLCCLGLSILSLVGIHVGRIGYHLDVVEATDPQALVPWAKCLYATPIIYSAACCFPRMVLLTLYLRIFNKHKPYRIACYSLMVFIVAFAIADMMAGAFECWPVSYMWDSTIPGGHCDNIPQFYRWGTLPNVIIDLMMLILPQPVIWKLQVHKHVRMGLVATFLTGSMQVAIVREPRLIGMITSICRCVAFFTNNPLIDGTWISVTFLNWSIIETGVYLIAACLPCYRPMVKLVLERTRTAVGSGYSSRGSKVTSANRPPNLQRIHSTDQDVEMATHLSRKLDFSRESDEQNLVTKITA
ncbi:hypothetical protein BO78DRAFT_395729 [Aspergillus sclerotiicarbonarius CBS 121057]|uniref:Rhodopsin domain-containing protein n=1 Tax=Aspergillus sclerotiicarbonarius (strain CBS 121057 / IBT 28362) TaxID=1448318 RepID=A0A319EDT8_ASPSB|nr:hypothetical protein BO78DRAFT_395729 [Aspergillus sclerotiicarbonarius CBS 121057]